MKKYLIIIFIIFLISCRNEEDPIYIPETIKIIETVTVEVTKVVEKEKIIYLDATYNPEPTWTPTPTPIAGVPWTPTPTPSPLATWTPTPTPIAGVPWTPTPTPSPVPTWTPTPTPTSTPAGWEFYLNGVLVTPTPTPPATWTPTPTPTPVPTWTPTPTPTPLPPNDLGFELTSFVSNFSFTSIGQTITFALPIEKSPIVDHDQDGDIINGIKTNDDRNFKIISVTQKTNSNSEITLLSITPINSVVTITFYTTRK